MWDVLEVQSWVVAWSKTIRRLKDCIDACYSNMKKLSKKWNTRPSAALMAGNVTTTVTVEDYLE